MGGGKGGDGASKDLEQITKELFKETKKPRKKLIDQYTEALKTGGVGARMPIIARAEEASRRATSNTLAGLEDRMAQMGLAGTPFGERIVGEAEQQGRFQTSQIAPNYIQQMLAQIPGFVTGANQTVVQGLGGAASAQAQMAGTQQGWLSALLSPFRFNF